jgi:hypothetical protein
MRFNTLKFRMLGGIALLGAVTMATMQNCSQVNFDNASEQALKSMSANLPESHALVYGSDAQDRQLLADRIAGYAAPGMSEIFNNWRRISSNTIYATGSAVIPEPAYAFCFTSLDANGNWTPGIDPMTKKSMDPSMSEKCIPSVSFASASWAYLQNPGRLHNSTNSNSFNGFISTLKFDHYVHEAVLTSSNTDDDAIGLIIAATVDANGNVHTLTAVRDQGGVDPANGWGVIYRKGNTVVKIIGNISVGGVNCVNGPNNCAAGRGDNKGWNGRMTKVRVERNNDQVVVTASPWGMKEADLVLESASRIAIDLSDSSLGLGLFQGPQSYGYGIQSQAATDFRSITFNAFSDDEYLYDLRDDLVYRQNATGGYSLVIGSKAFDVLGYPSIVGNVETQKNFRLNEDRTFDRLP